MMADARLVMTLRLDLPQGQAHFQNGAEVVWEGACQFPEPSD